MIPGQSPLPAIIDTANTLLQPSPVVLFTGTTDTPQGQRAIITIRTASTTLSIFLDKKDVQAWAGQLHGLAAQITASGLTVIRQPGIIISGPDGAAGNHGR
jgi:hypothetical protein